MLYQPDNALINELIDLKIIEPSSVIKFYPQVRDRADVGVLKCTKSGVIFLDRTDHLERTYYQSKSGTSYWSSDDRATGLKETAPDDNRRAGQIRSMVEGKVYTDVGSGLGGILDLMKASASSIHAVEPQNDIRENLKHIGYDVYDSIASLEKSGIQSDVITLFHVFEHITNPLESLKMLHASLKKGGKIVIEVPHANDALIKYYDLEAFKKFTFWGEHLILHTRDSLRKYLQAAGFNNIQVNGYQRFPLSNHLYWLKNHQPGGQNILKEMRDPALEKAYDLHLDHLDMTDTIIAVAEA
ncbi:MAG: class I SAM-dependent methyltransferase [Bacteroidia bacterium]